MTVVNETPGVWGVTKRPAVLSEKVLHGCERPAVLSEKFCMGVRDPQREPKNSVAQTKHTIMFIT